MTEQDLRALIRETVLKALAARGQAGASEVRPKTGREEVSRLLLDAQSHPSHGWHVTLVNVGEACLIEPAVTCNHCGYCKSHGH